MLPNQQGYQLGVCYYPEHWDQALWAQDMKRMLEAGLETVRVGEFCWTLFEPEEGIFDFSLFDRFLDTAEQAGMKVIFCTPTATPPAWLTEKYPEVLNCRKDGVPFRHGMRRHYNYNSTVYQALAERIVTRLAAHYAGRACIVGWQIDNELNCERDVFYSESDSKAFRVFLKSRYGTLDALNRAWGTRFWSQLYTDWRQIYVPRTTINDGANPHLALDYLRFISASATGFCRLQADILKKYRKPGDFLTTNGMFENMDNHQMREESLDVYMYDSYPNFAYGVNSRPQESTDLNDRRWSWYLTRVRSIDPHFGIMEQQSGGDGWVSGSAPAPRPGQLTLWAMQSIAHGADYVSFFRWRTSPFGTEMYWNGILDPSGRDNRRLAEVRRLHESLGRLGAMAGSRYAAKAALLRDYDNEWDAKIDWAHGKLAGVSETGIFQAAQLTHTPMDEARLRDNTTVEELAQYDVIFAPHMMIVTEKQAALLAEYVRQGGCLVLGCRSGVKEAHGQMITELLPGLFRDMSKADVYEFSLASVLEKPEAARWNDRRIAMDTYVESASVLDCGRVLAVREGDAGSPALIENRMGAGRVLYWTSVFGRETARVFLEELGAAEPWRAAVELPEDCELAVREDDQGGRYFIALNYRNTERSLTVHQPMMNLATGEAVHGQMTLSPFGTAVLRQSDDQSPLTSR